MEKYMLKKMVIKPTMSCTANCKTCQLRRDLHKSLINQRKLSFEQWLQIFKDASGLGVERLDISGGEPTLYKNLIGLIKAGKEYGWYINLNTNGSLINEDYAKRLIDAGLDSVSISIYSAVPQIHDEMRNCEGLWKKATEAVKTFNNLRRNSSGLQIATQCLICRENYKELADLMKLDYELGSDRIALTYLEGDFEKKYLLKEDEINDFKLNVIPKAKAFCETLDSVIKKRATEVVESVFSERINSVSNFANGLYSPEQLNPCQRPKEFTIILANGDVHPCNMVEYSHEPVMGNLFENSLPEIWNSEKWNQFRETLFEYCRLCPINLYMTVPLRPKNSGMISNLHAQIESKPARIVPSNINTRKKNISPSMWMHQTVSLKHRQLHLIEHGYPDLENTQYWPYEKLVAFQNAHLKVLLEYVYNNIPGYKRKFDNAGLLPADIKAVGDLKKLPVTTRHELQNNEEFVNQKLISGTLYTGGSTGTSLKYYESELSMLIRNEVHLRGWKWGGFQHDMKYCIMKSAQQIQIHGDCIHLIGDLTDENLKKNVDAVMRFKPQHLKGYVGSLYIFAKYCIDNNIQINGLNSVIPSSENLYDYQRQTMEQAFKCKVYEEYCCNDGGACAWECQKREGLHYAMERAIIEEEHGKMIVTDLWNLAMPFIRYENGDSVKFFDSKCSCGRQLPLIKVKGRTNDIIITPNGVITPTFLMHHGIGLVGVDKDKHNFRSGFRAVQYVQKPGNILAVNVVKNSWCTSLDIENFRKDLNEFVAGLYVNINFVDNIPATQKGKRSFVINEDKELLSHFQDKPFVETEEKPIRLISETNDKKYENKINEVCNTTPKISVLLSVYNGQKYIRQALESIYNQSFQDYEIIIIDDASTDSTADILQQEKDSRTFIKRNPQNIGLTKSLNIGLSLCRGKYIARMDADDISLPERFEKQIKFLEENPDCAAVGSWCIRIDENGRLVSNWRHPTDYKGIKERMLTQNSIFHGTVMIRKDSIFNLGCYNEKYRFSQDYDLWLRMSELFEIRNIGEFLYLSRVSRDSISNIHKQQQAECAELARQEAIQRKNICNMQSSSGKISAIDYFLKAKSEFEKDCYDKAVENIKKYNSLMDYKCSSRQIKSDRADIDISVVIVTYQRKDDLCKCLETVSNQDMGNYEIIIVDNGGCDYNAIERYADQYIKCPVNFNLSEGRNIGVHFARGKIVVFLDDDALVGNKYLSSIESAFEQYDIVGLRGKTLPKNNPAVIQRPNIFDLGDRAFPTYCNQEGNSAWLRDAYLSAGGMDPLLFGHEGSDLTYRVIQKYKNPAKVIYWPDAVIYHDYPTPQKSLLKRQVHQRNERYLKYKHNADIFFNRGEIEKYQVLRKTEVSQLTNSCEPAKNIDNSLPKISVIISCYNCQKYLPACLESIEAQSLQEWELFLIDDASTDNTKMLIEKFSQKDKRIRPYYFQDNKGPYVRRNFAIERANSRYIVIHDSDDIMHPNKLARLYEEIAKDEELTVVGSFYLTALDEFRGFDYADKIELPVNHNQIMENYKTQLYICWHGSAVIRRSMFETIGLYDENPYGSDKFWLAKAGEYARYTGRKCFKNIPEYLTYKIEHASSQQGTLTTLDPRSRRAGFQTYWLYKLMKIREKAFSDASINVAEELKNCKCGDYIERYGHLFHEWESKPLGDAVLCGFIERAVLQFNEKKYVSCIITLDSVEKIETNVTKRYHSYDFIRGMAYFAIGDKERCLKYLNNEISNHDNEVVKRFYDECVSSQVIKKVDKWCQENRGRYNPRVVEIVAIKETKPLVSVIMPAYNAAEYIAQAIDSVLRQDYQNFELIIINDGSTDDTGKIIEGFRDDRIKYFSQENHGLAATCNIGIRKSAGEYIVKLDSDDMITPDFLGRHIAEFEKNPHADLVYCDDCLIEQQGRIIRVIERPEYSEQKYLIRDLFRNGFPVVPFRTCIKKNVFDKIGFYDEELCMAEDYDMIRRFVMHDLKIQHLKGALYLRRLTSGSLSRDFSTEKAEDHFDVVERFAGTFDYEDLFPDIDWHKIPSQKRRFKAECLIAETFLAIGKSYLDTNTSPLYAQTAFAKARKHLSIALKIDPNNHQIRQLLNKYGTCRQVPVKRTAGHESPVAC
jgi:glycosyltransferase involved in cell wall biosynthesis/phenylacetate-coenzyme A ligase PaaK-like adenylate-forming protein/MoaA/NifB/PqqE/SkfB family radical SAM enzyme